MLASVMGWIRGQKCVHCARELQPSLPSPEEIQRMLVRERARADRTGHHLSLIVYPCEDQPELARVLVDILRQRLRSTDEVGWLDKNNLCAVLPDTPASGAWKAADDVLTALPVDLPFAGCMVYTYPEDDLANSVPDQPEPSKREAKPVAELEALLAEPTPLWKRAIDIAMSATALILLSPVLLLIAAAVKLTSRGPILFSQLRSGLGGKPFRMYKFRTMVVDAEARKAQLMAKNEVDGPAFKLRHDPRVTRLGRFLRATSLDELPQLFNVLRGDMSLVGPRPLPVSETDNCEGWHRQRLQVTPGLTCIWQVFGRSRVTFAEWMRMDVRYIRTRSPSKDAKLILRTIPAVLFRKGAY